MSLVNSWWAAVRASRTASLSPNQTKSGSVRPLASRSVGGELPANPEMSCHSTERGRLPKRRRRTPRGVITAASQNTYAMTPSPSVIMMPAKMAETSPPGLLAVHPINRLFMPNQNPLDLYQRGLITRRADGPDCIGVRSPLRFRCSRAPLVPKDLDTRAIQTVNTPMLASDARMTKAITGY